MKAIHESIEYLQLRLYKLTTKSHLRIGAGEGSIALSAADNPVIQALFYEPPKNNGEDGTTERVLYLPGSSLHGVIRSWAEKVHRSESEFLDEDKLKAIVAKLGANQQEALMDRVRREVGDYLGRSVDNDEAFALWRVHATVCDPLALLDQCQRFGQSAEGQILPAKQEWLELLKEHGRQNPCPICQVFGYVGQRGRVRIHPAFPAEGRTPLDIITRVAINRISGAADEGKLFDMEAVPPGTVFYFFVVLENMSDTQRQTFERGIRALQLQIATVGAHSTVGFGTVELEPVITATLSPKIFQQTNLPTEVQKIVRTGHTMYEGARGLDSKRYPSFYQALCMVERTGSKLPAAFRNDFVDIKYGAG